VTQLRQKMLEELQLRNYSHRTATAYIRVVREFADHFHKSPDKLGPEHIRQFQAHLFQTKKLSPFTVSQYVSALRFLFVKTLRRHFLTEHIPFPKCPQRLPTVLSPEEVTRLINASPNPYHRTLLTTLYSTAMRRAELCCLKVSDLDSQRMLIRIAQGKGRRDRYVPLSPKLLETLRIYWRWMQPKTFFVSGYRERIARRRPHPFQHGLVRLSAGSASSRSPQTPLSPLAASQLCFSPVGSWCRLAYHPGPTRAFPTGTHSGLPAPFAQASAGRPQSARGCRSLQPR
jgi:integrase/recombinase XerD